MRHEHHKRPPGRPVSEAAAEPTSETILKKAAELFTQYGYDAVSISDIATGCGVTKATIYYYYATKTDIFAASITDKLNQVVYHIEMILQRDEPLKQRLETMTELYLQGTHLDFESLLTKASRHLSEEQVRQVRTAEKGIYSAIAAEFGKAAERGEVSMDDPLVAAHAFCSMLMIGDRRYSGTHGLFASPREAAIKLVALFWQGIRP